MARFNPDPKHWVLCFQKKINLAMPLTIHAVNVLYIRWFFYFINKNSLLEALLFEMIFYVFLP
jgi:hypothetical protein